MNGIRPLLSRACALAALAAAGSAYGQATTGTPPPSTDETVQLPKFTVEGTAANQFEAADEVSASRVATPIIDTPMTVDVVTPALMQTVGPDTLFEVTQYFAGVSPGRGTGSAGINDRQTFRGFESFSRTVDNFSAFLYPQTTAGGSNFDPAFVEHVELIMGPDTILAPTGTPGGSMNLITKSPQFTQGTDVTAEFGNYDANKYTVDTTGPVGASGHMAYRVIGTYQDSETYLPGANEIYSASAQFEYKWTDVSKLTVKYFGSQATYKGTATLSNLDGEEVYTPDTVGGEMLSKTPQPGFTYNGWNGDATWSQRDIRDNTLEAELTSAIGDHITMRLAGQFYTDIQNATLGYPSTSYTEAWNQSTGQEISVSQPNPAALPEVATWEHYSAREIQLQNDYAGNWKFSGVTLQPSLGWAYTQGHNFDDLTLQDKSIPTSNASSYYAGPQPSLNQFTALSGNTPSMGWMDQAYAYLRGSFLSDHLFLSGGVARTWAGINDYTIPYYNLLGYGEIGNLASHVADNTFAHTGNVVTPSVTDMHDTYMGGAVYKILPNLSAYYSYSTNAVPASGTPIWQSGKQDEFGLKSSFLNGRLSVSVDHFEIVESNLQQTNPLFNTGQSTNPYILTDETNHGEELNIAGGITDDLSVIASYTNMHLRDFSGRRLRNIPDNMANALLDYHLPFDRDIDAYFGVLHIGDVAGETITGFTSLGVPELPGYYIPEYTVFNAGAGYKWNRYKFNLNIDNLFNQRFWWQASSRTSLFPYPGITVHFTVTVHI